MEEIITEEIKKRIGVESEPVYFDVEKGHIRRFAEAIGDPNPLYTDEKYARKTKYGTIIAPPTFVTALTDREWARQNIFEVECPLKRILNGGNEIELYEPIRAGDRICVTYKLVDATVREGKVGKMLFLIYEAYYRNQFGDLVAKVRNTIIRY